MTGKQHSLSPSSSVIVKCMRVVLRLQLLVQVSLSVIVWSNYRKKEIDSDCDHLNKSRSVSLKSKSTS